METTKFGPTARTISPAGSGRARSSQTRTDRASQGLIATKTRRCSPIEMCSHHEAAGFKRGEPGRSQLVVCEVKWQLSGSSTHEVIYRDEYLKKGLRQLEAIREFLTVHPRFLRSRALLDRSTQPSDFGLRRIERLSQHIPRLKGREICRPLDLIGPGPNGAAKHPRLTAHSNRRWQCPNLRHGILKASSASEQVAD